MTRVVDKNMGHEPVHGYERPVVGGLSARQVGAATIERFEAVRDQFNKSDRAALDQVIARAHSAEEQLALLRAAPSHPHPVLLDSYRNRLQAELSQRGHVADDGEAVLRIITGHGLAGGPCVLSADRFQELLHRPAAAFLGLTDLRERLRTIGVAPGATKLTARQNLALLAGVLPKPDFFQTRPGAASDQQEALALIRRQVAFNQEGAQVWLARAEVAIQHAVTVNRIERDSAGDEMFFARDANGQDLPPFTAADLSAHGETIGGVFHRRSITASPGSGLAKDSPHYGAIEAAGWWTRPNRALIAGGLLAVVGGYLNVGWQRPPPLSPAAATEAGEIHQMLDWHRTHPGLPLEYSGYKLSHDVGPFLTSQINGTHQLSEEMKAEAQKADEMTLEAAKSGHPSSSWQANYVGQAYGEVRWLNERLNDLTGSREDDEFNGPTKAALAGLTGGGVLGGAAMYGSEALLLATLAWLRRRREQKNEAKSLGGRFARLFPEPTALAPMRFNLDARVLAKEIVGIFRDHILTQIDIELDHNKEALEMVPTVIETLESELAKLRRKRAISDELYNQVMTHPTPELAREIAAIRALANDDIQPIRARIEETRLPRATPLSATPPQVRVATPGQPDQASVIPDGSIETFSEDLAAPRNQGHALSK